jgi:hypothetical protein
MTYNRPSTKIVGAPLMLASAIVILGIAWGERGSPGAAVGGPDFGLIGPGNRIYTRASFASECGAGDLFWVYHMLARLPDSTKYNSAGGG